MSTGEALVEARQEALGETRTVALGEAPGEALVEARPEARPEALVEAREKAPTDSLEWVPRSGSGTDGGNGSAFWVTLRVSSVATSCSESSDSSKNRLFGLQNNIYS